MAALLILDAYTVDERGYVFGPPSGSAGATLDRPGKTAGAASFPPCAFTDGNDGKNLGQTKKAGSGDERLILRHNKSSEIKVNFGKNYPAPLEPYRLKAGCLQALYEKNRRFSGFVDREG
jgi:hypothetical protein